MRSVNSRIGRLRHRGLPDDRVDHQVQQFLLGPDVPVQRHGARVQLAGDRPWVQAWPMQHPELAALLWSGLLLAVFAPLAVRLYTTKSR
jgi:hypothetical protein